MFKHIGQWSSFRTELLRYEDALAKAFQLYMETFYGVFLVELNNRGKAPEPVAPSVKERIQGIRLAFEHRKSLSCGDLSAAEFRFSGMFSSCSCCRDTDYVFMDMPDRVMYLDPVAVAREEAQFFFQAMDDLQIAWEKDKAEEARRAQEEQEQHDRAELERLSKKFSLIPKSGAEP